MLQYLVWQKQPPTFSQMIDALAVRLDDPGFKRENRLFDLMDVIMPCSSLLTLVLSKTGREIHLAHSSVKEYLKSQHLAEPFKGLLSEAHARSVVAKTSTKYIFDVVNIHRDSIMSSGKSIDELRNMTFSEVVLGEIFLGRPEFIARLQGKPVEVVMDEGEFPFLRPAGHYWAEHTRVFEAVDDYLPRVPKQLFGQERLSCGFPQILGPDSTYDNCDNYKALLWSGDRRTQGKHIHACYWGHEIVVQSILGSDDFTLVKVRMDMEPG
jgi:hypothetical protein